MVKGSGGKKGSMAKGSGGGLVSDEKVSGESCNTMLKGHFCNYDNFIEITHKFYNFFTGVFLLMYVKVVRQLIHKLRYI